MASSYKKGYYTKEFVELGGLRQYVTIRTKKPGSPVVLFLHGGPGAANIRVMDWYYHKSLAEDYTIVHWDQRGAGKSYSADIPAGSMNVGRFVEDLAELAKYLLEKLKAPKLFLVGESWGAFLGTLAVSKYPQYFYSFAAVSPGIAPLEGLAEGYEKLLEEARKSGSSALIRELESIGKPPYDLKDPEGSKNFWALRNHVVKSGGFSRRTPKWYIFILSLPDFIKYKKTMTFTSNNISGELYAMDLYCCKSIEIPYCIFQGKYDLITPESVSRKFFSGLESIGKDFIVFENSAHTLSIDEADRYVECLKEFFSRSLK